MKPYLTVLGQGEAEQVIERSRFIGYVIPAKTVTDCEEFFERIRKEHRQADHNVPAYVLGEGGCLQWTSDDGEPRGTSGAPVVHMLVEEGISDIAVCITRYFGGTKLGTGGLMRAYTGTAKQAIAAAGLGRVCEQLVIDIEIDYTGYERIKAAAGEAYIIENVEFTDKVKVSFSCDPSAKDLALEQMRTICPGACICGERTEVVTVPTADVGAASCRPLTERL